VASQPGRPQLAASLFLLREGPDQLVALQCYPTTAALSLEQEKSKLFY